MTTEIVPTTPDVTAIVAREKEQADAVRSALEVAITVLQAADIDTSDADQTATTFRGIGIARAVYPLLEQVEALAKKVRARADRVIGTYLTQSRSTGTVLGGVAYTYKGSPGTYEYQAEKLHRALSRLVGHVLTEDEFQTIAPAIVIPEQVIPAHTEYRIEGQALARVLKKRGGEAIRVSDEELMSFEAVVNQFRYRDPGVPRLRREGEK